MVAAVDVPDTAPTTAPAAHAVDSTRLEELSREVRALYQDAQGSLLRIQLPAPPSVSAGANGPLKNWSQLDPRMRARIAEQQAYSNLNLPSQETAPPAASVATQPAQERATTAPTTHPTDDRLQQQSVMQQNIIIVRGPGAPEPAAQQPNFIGGPLELNVKVSAEFAPNAAGLILDDRGHVLVPAYIERETCEGQIIHLSGPTGGVVEARFVGSDRPTSLTVLQLEKPSGRPARLADTRPQDGSIVLYISPADGSAHIGLWTGSPRDAGIVLTTDGRVAGIARNGQFLTGSACRLISDLLIRNGAVKRATLGVLITQMRQDDPLRRLGPLANGQGAMRIDQVISGSAADRAGLKVGDVLLAVGGEPVRDIPSFAAVIAGCDGTTNLEVLRDEKPLTVKVELHPGR